MNYPLDGILLDFPGNKHSYAWTLQQAVEGVQIFGGIGAGKTSGSGRAIALEYLKCHFGGLVLAVKTDERQLWEGYCRETGRLDDLIIINPDNKYCFNFLDYEMIRKEANKNEKSDKQEHKGAGLTANLVKVIKTVINAGELQNKKMSSNDAFWDNALDMLIFNIIDLCQLAYERIDLRTMFRIAQSIPKSIEELEKPDTWLDSEFGKALNVIRSKRDNEIYSFDQLELYKNVERYFLDTFIHLNDRTRSVVEHSFTGLLFQLSRDPVYSLFCNPNWDTKNNPDISISPEDSLNGKIFFIDLSVKEYDKIGREVQILFKYIWQRAMERRKVTDENNRPVFLWADEAQNFIHEHDIDYQATARSSRVCTVYLTQNLPNYLAHMGGESGRYHVMSFLGTLGTKIFHANVDRETNNYASDLIGQDFKSMESVNTSIGHQTASNTYNENLNRIPFVTPEQFSFLRTGGKKNKYMVDAIIHCQDPPWKNENMTYHPTSFKQKSK